MLWAALVCYSRIYAGLHYPMDILFGTALGLLLGAAAYRTYRKATAPRPEKRGWKRTGRLPGNAEKP